MRLLYFLSLSSVALSARLGPDKEYHPSPYPTHSHAPPYQHPTPDYEPKYPYHGEPEPKHSNNHKIYYDIDSLEELYNDNDYKSNVIEEYDSYGSRKYEKSDYDKAFGQKYEPKKVEYYEQSQYEHNPNTYEPHKPKYTSPERKPVQYQKKSEEYNPYTDNNGASDYVPYVEHSEKYSPAGLEYVPHVENTGKYSPSVAGGSQYIPQVEKSDKYNPYVENTGTSEYVPYEEKSGAYNPYVENTGTSEYVPYEEKSENYNPYVENTGGSRHESADNSDYVYDPRNDPYYESVDYSQPQPYTTVQISQAPNPAYVTSDYRDEYLPQMTRHGAGRSIMSSDQQTVLYTEDLSDYQSFVADCYERKFNSIKQGFGNDAERRVMRMYSSNDVHSTPEYPLALPSNITAYDYQTLSSSPHGRHLLMITLLEDFNRNYWDSRCEGLVSLYLPESLKSDRQPPAPYNACHLKQIRVDNRSWSRDDVLRVYGSILASRIGKDQQFSRFNSDHSTALRSLVKLALWMPDFDCMISLLTLIREYCNKSLFTEAIITIIQAREDVGFIIPSPLSISPEQFIPTGLARDGRQGFGGRVIRPGSTDSTYPPGEPERRMWHMREDPVYTTMHWTWHVILNDVNSRNMMRRRGEMFFHMHRQMLNRYNADRLAVGLGPVIPYQPRDWQTRGGLIGYDPRRLDQYSARRAGATMNPGEARNLANTRRRLMQAVDAGSVSGQRLGYVNGVDVGISALGDAVEPFGNNQGLGDYHNRGHVVISGMSETGNGVMGGTENAVRDPAFFRWHHNIDLVFARYKRGLGRYPARDLDYPGVTVARMATVSAGRQNSLRTFLTVDTLQLNNEELLTQQGVGTRYERIAYDPFSIRIQLQSTVTGFGIGRLFLVPSIVANANLYDFAIEMDKFLINLTPGTVNIERNPSQSPIFSRGPPSLRNLQNRLMRGMSERDFNWANCGYPISMALPRGSNNGMSFQLVLIVTQLLPQDRTRLREWENNAETAWGWCGLRDGQRGIPDGRPMGFPFDRPTNLENIIGGRSNAAATTVTITHTA
eukprot:TRINITY_DN214_c0_g1_i3.p1 TRINITY_DN214_c0_g1~~TRINITY_DN214_c0_g1_i3.p1  ORF type:complete len:1051 (-),score=178.18 TRINITY_DN214_c0_g1_i3:121-3273(-)